MKEKNKLNIFSAMILVAIFLTGLSAATKAKAEDIKIEKACSSGSFIRYTDCDSGKAISRSSMAPGNALTLVSADKKSFTIAITGGKGAYNFYAKLTTGERVDLGTFMGEARTFTLNKTASAGGWTSSGLTVYAPTGNMPKGQVAFPVAELGSCKDANDCKKYCDDSSHILACVDFAEKNGMMTAEEAKNAKEFADVLKGEGPGACKTKDACEAYCNGTSHMNECVSFAEKHNLIPSDQLEQAKKVAKALGEGAQLPGNCTDKKSCDSFCADSKNLDSCVAFAEKAGFMTSDELAQLNKVLPFLKSGETPGQCKTKDACEKYCATDANKDECASFAVKAGFMTDEEAALYKKTGGKGPGNCSSKEACDAYCNNPQNADACFSFAEEHDLIPADKLKEMKDGMARLTAGLKLATSEVVSCLKQNLGDDVIGKIESGTFTPNQQMGDTIQKCFESMKTEGMAKFKEGLAQMPPDMRSCLEGKLGKDFITKVENGEQVDVTPEMGTVMQDCATAATAGLQSQLDAALKQVPPEIQTCLKDKLASIEEKIKSGEIKGQEEIQAAIQDCMKGFKPTGVPSGMENYKPANAPEGTGSAMPEGVPSAGSTPPADYKPTAEMCAAFKMAPSCSYVPENVRDLCKKCQSN